MTIIIILAGIIASDIAFYGLISEEIKQLNEEIINQLKRIKKQNNLLQEEVDEIRLQLDEMWKDIKYIKNKAQK